MLGDNINIPKLSDVDVSVVTDKINWSPGGSDLYVIGLIALFVVAFIFLFKRDKIFSLLFSIYTSYIFIFFFPFHIWLKSFNADQLEMIKPGGFIVLILILFGIFAKSRIFASGYSGLIGRVIRGVVFGILTAGLFLSLLITSLPAKYLDFFSGLSLNILAGDVARFIWVAVPMLAILFLVKKRKGPGRPSLG